jgi:tetratricopeptide (TPR) repeat protein
MMKYRGGDTPVREIAAELGVDALIEPSVWWDADSVEIEVRLVDGETEEYVGDPIVGRGAARNVIGLYRSLVRQVIDELQMALSPEAEARLANAEPVNPEAYEDYLRGQVYWGTLSAAGLETALGYFEQALEKQPDFAQAHAGIALVWAARQQMGFTPPSEAAPKAREALARALAIDSASFEVQYAAAGIRTWVDWDWEAGEEAFRRTISLNPEFADARAYYSHLLMMLGRSAESEEQMDLAMELDPLNPLIFALYGRTLLAGDHFDEAIAFFQEALRTTPENPVAHDGLKEAYHGKGMHQEALAHAGEFYSLYGLGDLAEALQNAYAEHGHERAWLVAAERLAERADLTYVLPMEIAILFDWAGDKELAFSWLERAIALRDPNVPYLNAFLFSETLKADPRFKEIQRRMNLPVS